jgi:transposase-like protein
MSIQFACNADAAATLKVGRPNCPRCGSMLLMAEESEFNHRGRIRHAWVCDDCAHQFVTSIALPRC